MTELTQHEIASIVATGSKAGAHLDALGKTDLATMTQEEWLGFIEATVMAYAGEMAARHAPYAVLRSQDDPQATEFVGYSKQNGPIQSDEIPF